MHDSVSFVHKFCNNATMFSPRTLFCVCRSCQLWSDPIQLILLDKDFPVKHEHMTAAALQKSQRQTSERVFSFNGFIFDGQIACRIILLLQRVADRLPRLCFRVSGENVNSAIWWLGFSGQSRTLVSRLCVYFSFKTLGCVCVAIVKIMGNEDKKS